MKITGEIDLDALDGMDEGFLVEARYILNQDLAESGQELIDIGVGCSGGRVCISLAGELFGTSFEAQTDLAAAIKKDSYWFDAADAKAALITLRNEIDQIIKEM